MIKRFHKLSFFIIKLIVVKILLINLQIKHMYTHIKSAYLYIRVSTEEQKKERVFLARTGGSATKILCIKQYMSNITRFENIPFNLRIFHSI